MNLCAGFGPGLETRVGAVPVRIELGFVLMAAIVSVALGDVGRAGLFVVLFFVSVLLHEWGHVLAFRRAGVDARVVLHLNGGVTIGLNGAPPRRLSRVGVFLAGPFLATLVLGLPAWLALQAWDEPPYEWLVLLTLLVWINVYYSLGNLLPILPSDGGRVLLEATSAALGERRGALVAHVISALVALAAAIVVGHLIGGYLFGWLIIAMLVQFGVANVLALTKLGNHRMAALIAEAFTSLCDGDLDAARATAMQAVGADADDRLRGLGVELLIWVELTAGDLDRARAVFVRLPRKARRSPHVVAALTATEPEERIDGATRGFLDPTTLTPPPVYVASLVRDGLLPPIADRVLAAPGTLAADLRFRLVHALHLAGCYAEAAALGERILERDHLPARVAYNIACSRALGGDGEGAVRWLDEAFRVRGYRRGELLVDDDDLAGLRGDPRFLALVARYAPSGAPVVIAG